MHLEILIDNILNDVYDEHVIKLNKNYFYNVLNDDLEKIINLISIITKSSDNDITINDITHILTLFYNCETIIDNNSMLYNKYIKQHKNDFDTCIFNIKNILKYNFFNGYYEEQTKEEYYDDSVLRMIEQIILDNILKFLNFE